MFIGVDIGQSAVKATAFDADGDRTWAVSEGHVTAHPRPGWSEQDPHHWLTAAGSAVRQLLSGLNLNEPRDRIKAMSFTGATHHGVLVDASGDPVRNAITMRDLRSQAEVLWLKQHEADYVFRTTRNAVDPAWTLAHLRWLRNHDRAAVSRARRLVFGKDFLLGTWGDRWVTDRSEAEGSMLFNPASRTWDAHLVELSGLRPEQLPEIVECGVVVSHLNAAGHAAMGLPVGLPIVSGCSDTAAEAFCAGVSVPGDGIVKLATSGNVNIFVDRPDPRPEWVSYTSLDPKLFYQAFGTSTAASAYQWWRQMVDPGGSVSYETLEREAASVPAGAQGVFFLPYLAGRRAPRQDVARRAAFVGLDQFHTRGHLTRATFEGVAHMFRDCLDTARGWGHTYREVRLIGGGSESRVWRQIMSDILNLPILIPRHRDASAGAAMLAFMALTGAEDIADRRRVAETIEPNPESAAAYEALHRRFIHISQALAEPDHDEPTTSNPAIQSSTG